MNTFPVSVYGDAILREKAKKITKIDDIIIENIQRMFLTMRNANGVGLAANQVGWDKQIFVIDVSVVEDYENVKPLVMINPEIIEFGTELEPYEEGCLSLPFIKAEVMRPKAVKIKYLDTDENEQIIEDDTFLARVIQHEYDHLIGKMIPDRVESDLKKKMQHDLMRIMKRQIEPDYEITERDRK